MPRAGLAKIAWLLGAFVLSSCGCQNIVSEKRFACRSFDDCAEGFVCRGGECRKNDIPPGACFEGETKTCTNSACSSVCGPDGGFTACIPTTGGPFATNETSCGECGVQCSATQGVQLECVDNRCACTGDGDCTAGRVCNLGGVCVVDTDVCARQRCSAGEVCRFGTCAAVACDLGCDPGEVCDTVSGNCRLIGACRLPTTCPNGAPGTCEGDPKPDGAGCDDGVACTFGDSCVAGACNGTAYACPPPGACQTSVACAGDGGCSVVAIPDGTGCDDGNPCTFNDSCSSGACNGTAYTCTPTICASASVCAGDGGCINTPRNPGFACDDAVACTHTDVCDTAGSCVGTSYTCPGVTECKQAGVCLGDAGCSVVDKANGTACDAGTGCTVNDTCANGACVMGTAINTYQDLDGDGRGNANIVMTVCPAPAGFVPVGGDCNDNSAFVQTVLAAVQDVDQDGYTNSLTLNATACVGAAMTINGRTYYRDTSGAYTWLAAASATVDCDDGDPQVFVTRASMVTDADHDGYHAGSAASACVGASQTFNGRTYYENVSGTAVYLDSAAALGATECNDGNAVIYRTVASLFADSDQDGWTVGSAAAQCVGNSTTISGRTYYQNSAGAFFYVTTSLGSDCNDASNAVLGPTNWYADGDSDGVGAGAPTSACTAPGGYVATGTDCNNANGNVHTTRTVYADADNDGWTTAAGLTSQCTGNSTVINTRTYYRNDSGFFSWGAASLGVDCDDGNSGIFGATTWYLDGDGDGFGNPLNSVLACTNPGGRVGNNTDCNDASGNVYRTIAALYNDPDQDGYGPLVGQQCVGDSTVVSGRTYYRDTGGSFIYTPNFVGASDCNNANALVVATTPVNVVQDNDRDGYPPNNTQSTPCAGPVNLVGTRDYYQNADGGWWMDRIDCINRTGSNCVAPFDSNDAVFGP